MKLNKKFLTAAVLTTSILVSAAANTAQALCLNPACLARMPETVIDEGQKIVNRTMNYEVTIRNPTNNFIQYSFEGRPRLALAPGQGIKWTGTTVEAPSISFDNGQHQQVSHGLSREGSYYFAWQDNTLVLYAD